MPPRTSRRLARRLAPALFLPLALAAPAEAGGARGSLAVSVEVVESCRVPAASGQGSELVPCPQARTAPLGRAPARAAAPIDPPAAARTVVEPAASGTGHLLVVY